MPTVDSTAPATTATLHYEDSGGDGRPVVLIHGWPLSAESWHDQIGALKGAGHRVIAYDRRGFGQSSKPDTGYDYDTFAADLEALLRALDLREVTLVGFSMGGGEVARYLGRYGSERVRSAVFAAAVPPYLYKSEDNPDGGLDDATIEQFRDGAANSREEFLDSFLTGFFSAGDDLKVSEDEKQDAFRLTRPAADAALVGCIGAFSRTDFRDDLATIDVPVLVVHGDSDAIVPFEVSGRRTHESVADSTLALIEGGPHGLNVSHADEFNAALLEFLAER
ncbi:alpha/beta fold hydrolase [Aeromicrobium sp.]|uniref:alpha/beta fold hydrolase n=1 Tax=Aeromicrobium sp. TaxID=1871063 RepID=UPI003D6C2BA5